LPRAKSALASTQSPRSTKKRHAVAIAPRAMNPPRKGFLREPVSAMAPRIGPTTAMTSIAALVTPE